jgi:hypothetical protein
MKVRSVQTAGIGCTTIRLNDADRSIPCGERMNSLFVKALKKGFDMTQQDATQLAKTVQKVFRGRKEVEDMSLDKHVRSIFYDLLQKNLLMQRREEIKENGKFIRKYFWSFNNDGIKAEVYRKPLEESPYEIYEKIPRSAWLIHSENT